MSDQSSERSGLATDEIYAQMRAIASLMTNIPVADVRAVVEELGFIDAAMPLIDPTGYRKIMGTKPGHDRFARAFLVFRLVLEELKEGA